MRLRSNLTAIFAVTILAACQGGSASLETDDQIASYGFGLDIGASLEPTLTHLDRPALLRGIEDALDELEPAISVEQIAEVTQRVGTLIREEQSAEFEAMTETNRGCRRGASRVECRKGRGDRYRQRAPVRGHPGG